MMESDFAAAQFQGQQADITLSPSLFRVQTGHQQVQILTANIIAIVVRDSEKVGVFRNRVRALIFAIRDDCKNESDKIVHNEHSLELKTFEIEYVREEKVIQSRLILPHLPDHLLLPPYNGQPSIHVIVSTFSGTQKAESFFEQCLKPLLDRLEIPPYDVHKTDSPDTVSQLVRCIILPRASQGIKQLILLLSGDGGIFDFVNTLFRQELVTEDAAIPIIALFPMGTGNALFNSSCRPRASTEPTSNSKATSSQIFHKDKTRGLRTLLLGKAQALPTFRVTLSHGSKSISYSSSSSATNAETLTHTPLPISANTPNPTLHGAVLLSWCLHASLISLSDAPKHRLQGSSRFSSAAQSLLSPADGSSAHVYHGVVSTLHHSQAGEEEWRPLRERDGNVRKLHMYILATLVSNLEEGFTISPASEPLDGKIRLVSIGDIGVEEVVRVLGLAYQGGKHVAEDGKGIVGYGEVEGLRIDFEEDEEDGRWRTVCVDGLVVECPKGGWVEMRRDSGREVVKLVVL
jgi:Diacylglycerol kinase catalytic domain